MLKEILEYQKKDSELVEIEREIAKSPAKNTVNQMVDYVKQAQQKLVTLEKNASNLIAEYEELRQQYESSANQAELLSKEKFSNQTAEELRENSAKIAKLNANILNIEKNITQLSKKIINILSDFEKTKTQGVEAKKKHSASLDKYNSFVANNDAKINKINGELKILSIKVEPKLFEKYQELREDKKFPIFVPLINNGCGGCSMEIPRARLDILKREHILECENCRRMIYLLDEANS